jgi:cyclopropane fatty-acyl-phospholipid synthase-like methyltransferase
MKSFDASEAAAYDARIRRVVPGYDVLQQAVSHFALELGPSRVLCNGTGTGAEAIEIAAKLPTAEIEAAEPSEAMRAVGKVRTSELANVTWVDEPTGKFELVTSVLVGHFVSDQLLHSYFSELGERTSDGGTLLFAVMAAPTSKAEGAEWTHHLATKLNQPADYDGRLERAEETYRTLKENVILRPVSAYEEAADKAGFQFQQIFFRRPMIHGLVYRKS